MKITITGNDKEATIDDKETYLKIMRQNEKTKKDNSAENGLTAINKPNIVAIPFPPLKPVYTGNKWPITADIPNTI